MVKAKLNLRRLRPRPAGRWWCKPRTPSQRHRTRAASFQAGAVPVPPLPSPAMAFGNVTQLATTCALMFFGALGAGMLPLFLSITEGKLQAMTALGAGLLMGAALTVVIPEGFEAFHHAQQAAGHAHALPEGAVGAALIAGFLAMLLLDQFQRMAGGHHHHHHHHADQLDHRSDDELVVEGLATAEHKAAAKGSAVGAQVKAPAGKGVGDVAFRALLGLIVHSASDGFAIGAASVSHNVKLETMIAIAMVLHKAPMAFGLATFLMSARWPWAKAQKALVVFAATPPVFAVLTYLCLSAVPSLSSPAATALCMLFSGGTFLYAACIHILPEVMGHHGQLTKGQLLAVVVGCIIPLLTASLAPHEH
ncbi:hypothetical protein WJX72_003345 [[Myrmecia] bisecta]|uniref:Uncharacterized protein n=1 Tax=[Myrmecia] bisecta TaxID=41462 RepID=A0AAW1PFA7_9CHLO